MEYSKLKSLLRRVIVVPIVATAALAGLLLWETFDLNKSLQRVDHTDRVLDQSGHLLMSLVDMESGMRGYIATSDETLLHQFTGQRCAARLNRVLLGKRHSILQNWCF